jgi:SAM-dependent methyltransferase
LDVAPQDYQGAKEFFKRSVIKTLDIDPSAGADYVADITQANMAIPDETFDYVLCTEVLEHTLQPFRAVREIHRLLKMGGLLFASVPFNFRIHGPLPDCWRFTEHGLRALLVPWFEEICIEAVESPGRPLMPIHYTFLARKTQPTNHPGLVQAFDQEGATHLHPPVD